MVSFQHGGMIPKSRTVSGPRRPRAIVVCHIMALQLRKGQVLQCDIVYFGNTGVKLLDII